MREFNLIWNAVQGHVNRWLFVLAIILLSSILSGCEKRDDQPNEQNSLVSNNLNSLADRLGAVEAAVQQQRSAIKQQSTVLQQILDNVSPATMPPEWESRLTQLEDQASNASLWPKDAAEAGRFLEQASELVAGLPARAEPQYLQRLSPVRWAAMAFTSLERSSDTGQTPGRLDQLVDELRALADAKPEGGAETLVQALGERAAELVDEAARRRVTEAAEQAERYVEGSTDATEDIAKLYEFLELYATDHEIVAVDVDIPALRKRLYKEMLRRQAVEQAGTLRDRWETARQLEHRQPAVYEAAARTLLQQVVSAQVALVLEGVTGMAYAGLEHELRDAIRTIEIGTAKRAEMRRAQAVRLYQRWALSGIKKFEDAVQGISRKVAKATSWLDTVNPTRWDEPDYLEYRQYNEAGQYREVAQAMIDHLLPVNLALLDLPVHERYQQAFQTGWQKLDGRDDQTDVAKASAVTAKKSLREFLEDGS